MLPFNQIASFDRVIDGNGNGIFYYDAFSRPATLTIIAGASRVLWL
jgi:hypothetical protein